MELLCRAASLNYKLFAALETQSNTEIQHFLVTFFLIGKSYARFLCMPNKRQRQHHRVSTIRGREGGGDSPFMNYENLKRWSFDAMKLSC